MLPDYRYYARCQGEWCDANVMWEVVDRHTKQVIHVGNQGGCERYALEQNAKEGPVKSKDLRIFNS